MAVIVRSAKPDIDWTVNGLFAYNIRVVNEDVATFFGSPDLPQFALDPIILDNTDTPPGPSSKSTLLFFRYLTDAVTRFPPGAATAVNDFAAFLLSLLSYDEPDRVVHRVWIHNVWHTC